MNIMIVILSYNYQTMNICGNCSHYRDKYLGCDLHLFGNVNFNDSACYRIQNYGKGNT
jgi:hypothetical protein